MADSIFLAKKERRKNKKFVFEIFILIATGLFLIGAGQIIFGGIGLLLSVIVFFSINNFANSGFLELKDDVFLIQLHWKLISLKKEKIIGLRIIGKRSVEIKIKGDSGHGVKGFFGKSFIYINDDYDVELSEIFLALDNWLKR